MSFMMKKKHVLLCVTHKTFTATLFTRSLGETTKVTSSASADTTNSLFFMNSSQNDGQAYLFLRFLRRRLSATRIESILWRDAII